MPPIGPQFSGRHTLTQTQMRKADQALNTGNLKQYREELAKVTNDSSITEGEFLEVNGKNGKIIIYTEEDLKQYCASQEKAYEAYNPSNKPLQALLAPEDIFTLSQDTLDLCEKRAAN